MTGVLRGHRRKDGNPTRNSDHVRTVAYSSDQEGEQTGLLALAGKALRSHRWSLDGLRYTESKCPRRRCEARAWLAKKRQQRYSLLVSW